MWYPYLYFSFPVLQIELIVEKMYQDITGCSNIYVIIRDRNLLVFSDLVLILILHNFLDFGFNPVLRYTIKSLSYDFITIKINYNFFFNCSNSFIRETRFTATSLTSLIPKGGWYSL